VTSSGVPRRTLDLTHPFVHDGNFNPDLPQPSVRVVRQVVSDSVRLEELVLTTHVGTHMDAPNHVFETAGAITDYPLDRLHGYAVTADLRHLKPGARIDVVALEQLEPMLGTAQIVLLRTGWGDKRDHTELYVNSSPWLDGPGAQWLVDHGVYGVAIDHFSIAGRGPQEQVMPAHKVLLGAGVWIVEDAYLPDELWERDRWYVVALPLPVKGASGGQTRMIAIDPDAFGQASVDRRR
jgi:kynurenine formamidase